MEEGLKLSIDAGEAFRNTSYFILENIESKYRIKELLEMIEKSVIDKSKRGWFGDAFLVYLNDCDDYNYSEDDVRLVCDILSMYGYCVYSYLLSKIAVITVSWDERDKNAHIEELIINIQNHLFNDKYLSLYTQTDDCNSKMFRVFDGLCTRMPLISEHCVANDIRSMWVKEMSKYSKEK